jgi:hypothetical protein
MKYYSAIKKNKMPFDSVIPLLGIYPKECKTGYSRDTCIPMFTSALFTIATLQMWNMLYLLNYFVELRERKKKIIEHQ